MGAKKILVAADGSTTSVRGVQHAVKLAKEQSADLIALFVDTSFEDMDLRGYGAQTLVKDVTDALDVKGIDSSEIIAILERHYEQAIKPVTLIRGEAGLEVASMLAGKEGVKIKTMIERGRAPETIVAVAKDENVDMIVIGSHGRKGFDGLGLGSVAERVGKLASCPVLIVKPESVE